MSNLGPTGRRVDSKSLGRQICHVFLANRKSLTAQTSNDRKDATDIPSGSKFEPTDLPMVINDISSENSTSSAIREHPNSLHETVENASSEETFTALKADSVVLAPQLDVQGQAVSIKTYIDRACNS